MVVLRDLKLDLMMASSMAAMLDYCWDFETLLVIHSASLMARLKVLL